MATTLVEQAWFTGPKTKHPLTDPATVKVLLARQAAGESTAVLKKITAWTDELMSLPELPLADRFAVLDLLDRHAKNHQISLVPAYLETARLRKASEGALWATSFEFWRAIGDAYLTCLDRYQSNPEPAGDQDYLLPILVGRILRSLTVQLKWTLLRHEWVGAKLWHDLGRVYLFAESRNFATRRIAVYDSAHGESSAQAELLKVLMLAISSPEALSPAQQHIAERIVAHFGDRFAISMTPNSACHFSFDLASGMAPGRNGQNMATPLLVRHFGPDVAIEGLRELTAYLRRNGTLPPYIRAGFDVDRHQVEAVLRHLGRQWADLAIPRTSQRQPQSAELTVAPGLSENVGWLKRMLAAGNFAADQPAVSERWLVNDASENGCGALAPQQPGDWVEIGTLVGVQSAQEGDGACRMGVVRRVARDGAEQNHVGLELIGDAALPVSIFPLAATPAANPDLPGEAAVLVSRHPDEHGTVELLCRPDGVALARGLQMRLRNRVHKLEQVHFIEQTAGFLRARYRVL